MNFISIINFVKDHPLNQNNKIKSILRLLKWQINTRLNPYPIIYQWTDKAKLIVQKGMTGATGNLYCGLHEYNDMAFLLHFLREDDTFADIGANIGSYTVLASGHIRANTVSFEPVPSTFRHLENNILINNILDKVIAYNIALGSKQDSIAFTSSLDTTNHVANKNETNTIKVPIDLLDNVMKGKINLRLIKIDVEGFETEVINGAMMTLKQKDLKAIIIELNGSGSRYGYNEKVIHHTLLDLDFKPFQYMPKERKLTLVDSHGTHNTIYIRDIDFVLKRLRTAEKIKILDNEI
jgi:FkbM family methyltransferase